MKYFLVLLILIGFSGTAFAVEDETPFEKSDWGAGLTKKECQDRIDLMPTYFEPMLNLAKLKAENHPTFKQITQNKMYELIETGVTAIEDSKNCDSPIPSFELHYATDISENSYTRIYVSMDYVSYDVLKIMIRHIDDEFYPVSEPQPLPFYIRDWNQTQIVGKYVGSDPPVPDQTFKLPYVVIDGKIKNIKSVEGGLSVELIAREDALAKFAFKVPRNYPYTDHDDTQHPGHGLEIFPIFEITEENYPRVTKSDCFYDVWIPFSKNSTMEFGFQIGYLQGGAFHGDKDIPRYCLDKTIVDESRDKISKLTPLKQVKAGVFPYDVSCKEWMQLVVKHGEKPACVSQSTASKLFELGWVDKSINIYTKYGDVKIQEQFKEKFITKEDAIESVKEFIKQTNLKLDIDSSEIQITSSPAYTQLSKGSLYLLGIDFTTGLPTEIMPPMAETYYRTPGWYNELQKDYLGINNTRVDDGDVYWEVTYRTCLDCIASYPMFFVNPIDGKVEHTHAIESLFNPIYE